MNLLSALTTVPLLFVSLLGAVSQTPSQLSLVDEYRHTDVFDVSDDGHRMLIYARGRITVFDLQEKRKVASWKSASWPESAWFVGKGDSVYYHDFLGLPRIVSVEDPKVVKICPYRGFFGPLDDRSAFGFGSDRENPPLLNISLEDCSIITETDLEFEDGAGPGGPAVSLKTGRFAYLTSRFVDGVTVQLPRETALWVRDLASFEVVAFH